MIISGQWSVVSEKIKIDNIKRKKREKHKTNINLY